MKKQIVGLSLAFILLFLVSDSIFADGMVIFRPDPYSDRWDYSDETDQQAFINYQNGLEKMVVGIKVDPGDKGAVWLFPVPADPSKVVMDVVDELPQMNGEEISARAKMNLSSIKDILFGSQIYPLLFKSRREVYRGEGLSNSLSAGISKGAVEELVPQDVTVYEHLDKEGMTSELITAKTADGLYKYFQDKGLKIGKGMIPALDSYIGKDYSFVASWMSNPSANIPEQVSDMGVREAAGIPAQDIIGNLEGYLGTPAAQQSLLDLKTKYPNLDVQLNDIHAIEVNGDTVLPYLRSDAGKPALDELVKAIQSNDAFNNVYIGSQPLPPSIIMPQPEILSGVKGVSVIFPAKEIYFPLLPTSVYESKIVPATIKIAGFVSPDIYQSIANFTKVSYYANASFYSGQNGFFDNANANNYTKIEISAPSKYLTEDLWAVNRAPLKTAYSSFIGSHQFITAAILMAILSLLAAFIVGWLLFKDLRKRPDKLAMMGILNCASIIGLILATFFVATGNDSKRAESSIALKEIKQKGYIWKRRTALVLFAAALVTLPFSGLFAAGIASQIFDQGLMSSLIAFLIIFLPAIFAIAGWRASQIKYEDGPLFAQIKKEGYSTWFFVSMGGNKVLFIVSFSVLFLIISSAMVELLKLTV